MKVCPACGAENHDQAVECKKCLKPFPGYVAGRPLAPKAADLAQPVRITDVDMPFGSMVWFMVKWAIATIPALIILMFVGAVLIAILSGFFGLGLS